MNRKKTKPILAAKHRHFVTIRPINLLVRIRKRQDLGRNEAKNKALPAPLPE